MNKACLGVAISGVLTVLTTGALAQDGTCYALAEPIIHPPKFTEQIDCIECPWWGYAASPHCCTYGCEVFPECQVVRSTYEEGWEELFECDYSAEEFFEAYVAAVVDPKKTDPGPFWAFIDTISLVYGDPLPDDVQELVIEIGSSSLASNLDWLTPLSLSKIRVARQGDLPVPIQRLGERHAHGSSFGYFLTLQNDLYDQIFNNPAPPFQEIACEWERPPDAGYQDAFETLLHELIHTVQYENMGGTEYALTGYYGILNRQERGELEDGVDDWLDQFWIGVDNRLACVGSTGQPLEIASDGDWVVSTDSMGGLALYATEYLKINDRARIRTSIYEKCEEDIGQVFKCHASVGTAGDVYVGVEAQVGHVLGTAVDVRDRAVVFGSSMNIASLFGIDVLLGGLVFEVPEFYSVSVLDSFSVDFPPLSNSLPYIPPNTMALPLDPGEYHELNVSSGSQVVFSAGDYYFDRLVLEPHSEIMASGGIVRIFVQSDVIFRGDLVAEPSELLFVYTGSNPMALEGMFNGTLIAPNAEVSAQSRAVDDSTPSHQGALFASTIELHQQTNWHHVPFSDNVWSP